MLIRSIVALAAITIFTASAYTQTKLLRFPDIAGDRIVFTYGGDLWTSSAAGGTATRLTAHPGRRDVCQVLSRREMDRLHRPI
jgi:tricorn protease